MLAAVKGGVLVVLLTLVVVGGQRFSPPTGLPGATSDDGAYQRVVARAVVNHHCSYDGSGQRATPSSALIRTERGAVRQVSFSVGWDVYTHQRPGTLIAVCVDAQGPVGLVKVSDN